MIKNLSALQTHYTNGEEFLIDHLSSTRNSSLHEKLSLARLTFTGVDGCMERLRSTWLEVRDEKFICSVYRMGLLCADGRDFSGRKNPCWVCLTGSRVIGSVDCKRDRKLHQAWDRRYIILLRGSPRLVQSLIAGDVHYALVRAAAVMRARM